MIKIKTVLFKRRITSLSQVCMCILGLYVQRLLNMTSKALAVNPLFTRILNCFPHEHVKFAFAYGSGTFQQHGNSDVSTNMLDFVFAVDNSVSWHAKNLTLNPKHYAFIRNVGPRYLAAFQEKF